MSPTTVAYGSPQRTQAGRPIARAGGCMNPATTGPGSPMSPGAGRRITTAAGSSMAGTGAGGRDLSMADIIRFGPRRTSLSSALAAEAGAAELGLVLAAGSATLAGCRAARATASSLGTAAAGTG